MHNCLMLHDVACRDSYMHSEDAWEGCHLGFLFGEGGGLILGCQKKKKKKINRPLFSRNHSSGCLCGDVFLYHESVHGQVVEVLKCKLRNWRQNS